MNPTLQKLLDRFKEPSSWTALMGMLAGVGFVVPDGIAQSITFAGAAICCALGFCLKEKANA